MLEEVGDDKEGNNLDDLVAHARTPASAERLEVLRLLELKRKIGWKLVHSFMQLNNTSEELLQVTFSAKWHLIDTHFAIGKNPVAIHLFA